MPLPRAIAVVWSVKTDRRLPYTRDFCAASVGPLR